MDSEEIAAIEEAPQEPTIEELRDRLVRAELLSSVRQMEAPTVALALVAVARELDAIPKNRENQQGEGFKFRGIEDFLNTLHPILARNGVTILPTVVDRQIELQAGKSQAGNPLVVTHVWVRMQYRFMGPRGDTVSTATEGEGLDRSDKATNKAMSAALKYALMQTFSVPTQDIADSDRESPEATGQLNSGDDTISARQQYWRDKGWPASTDEEAQDHKTQTDELRKRIQALPAEHVESARAFHQRLNGRAWPPSAVHFDALLAFVAGLEPEPAAEEAQAGATQGQKGAESTDGPTGTGEPSAAAPEANQPLLPAIDPEETDDARIARFVRINDLVDRMTADEMVAEFKRLGRIAPRGAEQRRELLRRTYHASGFDVVTPAEVAQLAEDAQLDQGEH